MATNENEIFETTPVGRLVQGDVHKGRTTDRDGKPLTVKTGPNAGQPRTDYFFAVAIPKGPEQGWWETPWGKAIFNAAVAAWPQGQTQRPDFAWKIDDGDSQIPNKEGRVNAQTEGFAGHWIVRFSSGYAPSLYNADGTEKIMQEGVIKRGYFVQVHFSVKGNGNSQSPGVYLSPIMVAFSGYGEEIKGMEIDAKTVGFGQAPLPAGAMTTPPAGLGPVAAPTGPAPAAPAPYSPPVAAPVAGPTPYSAPVSMPPAAAPAAPAPMAPPPPNPAILQPPAAPVRKLTALAQGATYEQLIAAGWDDTTLIANGLMEA